MGTIDRRIAKLEERHGTDPRRAQIEADAEWVRQKILGLVEAARRGDYVTTANDEARWRRWDAHFAALTERRA